MYIGLMLAFKKLKQEGSNFFLIKDLVFFNLVVLLNIIISIMAGVNKGNFISYSIKYNIATQFFTYIYQLPSVIPISFASIFTEEYRASFESISIFLKFFMIFKYVEWANLSHILKNHNTMIEYSLSFIKINSKIAFLISAIARLKGIICIILFFVMLSHFSACAFIYLSIESNNGWIPRSKLRDEAYIHIYFTSLNYIVATFLTVGYGDIVPQNTKEIILAIIFLMMGCFLYTYMLTALSFLFKIHNEYLVAYYNKLTVLSKINQNYLLPDTLYMRIKRNLQINYKKGDFERHDFISGLPNIIKNELVVKMYGKMIYNLEFFKFFQSSISLYSYNSRASSTIMSIYQDQLSKAIHVEEFISFVVPYMKKQLFYKQEEIWSFNQLVDEMFFIESGKVDIKLPKEYQNYRIGTLLRNKHYGEVLMFSDEQISPFDFIVSSKKAEIYFLSQKDFHVIKERFPEYINAIISNSVKNHVEIENIRMLVIQFYGLNLTFNGLRQLLKKIIEEEVNEHLLEMVDDDKNIQSSSSCNNTLYPNLEDIKNDMICRSNDNPCLLGLSKISDNPKIVTAVAKSRKRMTHDYTNSGGFRNQIMMDARTLSLKKCKSDQAMNDNVMNKQSNGNILLPKKLSSEIEEESKESDFFDEDPAKDLNIGLPHYKLTVKDVKAKNSLPKHESFQEDSDMSNCSSYSTIKNIDSNGEKQDLIILDSHVRCNSTRIKKTRNSIEVHAIMKLNTTKPSSKKSVSFQQETKKRRRNTIKNTLHLINSNITREETFRLARSKAFEERLDSNATKLMLRTCSLMNFNKMNGMHLSDRKQSISNLTINYFPSKTDKLIAQDKSIFSIHQSSSKFKKPRRKNSSIFNVLAQVRNKNSKLFTEDYSLTKNLYQRNVQTSNVSSIKTKSIREETLREDSANNMNEDDALCDSPKNRSRLVKINKENFDFERFKSKNSATRIKIKSRQRASIAGATNHFLFFQPQNSLSVLKKKNTDFAKKKSIMKNPSMSKATKMTSSQSGVTSINFRTETSSAYLFSPVRQRYEPRLSEQINSLIMSQSKNTKQSSFTVRTKSDVKNSLTPQDLINGPRKQSHSEKLKKKDLRVSILEDAKHQQKLLFQNVHKNIENSLHLGNISIVQTLLKEYLEFNKKKQLIDLKEKSTKRLSKIEELIKSNIFKKKSDKKPV